MLDVRTVCCIGNISHTRVVHTADNVGVVHVLLLPAVLRFTLGSIGSSEQEFHLFKVSLKTLNYVPPYFKGFLFGNYGFCNCVYTSAETTRAIDN